MKKLLKIYSLKSDMQYFEMIVESVINGQLKQATNQFKAMPRPDRKEFVKAIYSSWDTGLNMGNKEMFIELL